MNKELISATRANDLNRVRELITAGADVNFREQTILGATPLIYAARKENENIIHLLIDSGADINGVDGIGQSALHNIDNENIVRILIDAGIDLNIRDDGGRTALMEASYFDRLSIVKMLIEGGANIYIKNKDGKNVVELVNELYRNDERMNSHEKFRPGSKERMKSIIKILENAEIEAQKEAFYLSMIEGLPRDERAPLVSLYDELSNFNPYLLQDIADYAFGEKNEGAEESKSNRGDAGSRRRKSVRRKSKSKTRRTNRKKSKNKIRKSKSKTRRTNRKKSKNKIRKSGRK